MPDQAVVDFYEVLQISPNAEPETIHRVYRLLAQRYHPDNSQTGGAARFRALVNAYDGLSDPEKRARYDLTYFEARQRRWRPIVAIDQPQNQFEVEETLRLTILEVLYER